VNQKMLYVAIVAAVAAVIVLGIWLSGAGQSGSLSGEIVTEPVIKPTFTPSPTPTPLPALTLFLDRSTCHAITFEVRGGTLRGTLLNNNGEPLAGRTIEIYGQSATPGWSRYPSTQTLEDGSFSADVAWVNVDKYDFKAQFAGDADNPPAEAIIWDIYC
jgi:hypothetical protein